MQTTTIDGQPPRPPSIAVLLIAYGGPSSLEEVEPFVRRIRGGRPMAPEVVEEIKRRYALIGGKSPLTDITQEQAKALQTQLSQDEAVHFRVYVGMRHWQPGLADTVARIAADGADHILGLYMSPYYSSLTAEAAFRQLDQAVQDQGIEIPVGHIPSWNSHPGLISALAQKASAGLKKSGGWEPQSVPNIVFTAHSLPRRILEQGDPYDTQVRETAALVARQLGLTDEQHAFAYQSAGHSPEPWLGPPLKEKIQELAQAGQKQLYLIPVGFLTDNMEILYDIDIECQQLASELGIRLERSPSLNASPALIATLADLVRANTTGDQ